MRTRLYAKSDPEKRGPYVEVEEPRSLLPHHPAARFSMLMDMYAPEVELDDGTTVRDPAMGVITKEQFLELLDSEQAKDE